MNFVIPYHIYPCSVMFSIGQTEKELNEVLIEHVCPEAIAQGYHLLGEQDEGNTFTWDNGFTLIQLRALSLEPKDVATLTHEIAHAVFNLMFYIGMPLTRESAEGYTYLIDYLTREVLKRAGEKI